MRTAKIVVFQSEKDKQWYWHLLSANGQIVAHGEGYTRKRDALRFVHELPDLLFAVEISESTE